MFIGIYYIIMKSQVYKLDILTIKAGVDMVWCPVINEGGIVLHQEDGQPLSS